MQNDMINSNRYENKIMFPFNRVRNPKNNKSAKQSRMLM